MFKPFGHILYGGDYNPDQWIRTKEIWDEDMRLMRLAHINSATVGIFSWSMLEPEEGVYDFGWLDEIMDKLHANGISAVLSTPSGARPAWLAQKYPEVLRVGEDGIRNEYGVRHNHCMTSPVYREKVRNINRRLAERYKDHPALKLWHISNEYSGECHCELCQQAFRDWLKKEYENDLALLNEKWWSGFWSHRITDWSQISSPKDRGENHVSALKLAWRRFVSDSHISFFENEIVPLREITPDVPVTTNFMRMYDGIDYQRFAQKVDVVSWDNYPAWELGDNQSVAAETAFVHDAFRSMKQGQPFLMMESTPSTVNWRDVNRIPRPGMQRLTAVQAVAHGADSVQYFQWRKSRGSHEKFHGAVVDHCGHEDTRVFREVAGTGKTLEKLSAVVGQRCASKVAILYDWENDWAVKSFCGFNNKRRDYLAECVRWYRPFWERGVSADVISMDGDFAQYDLIIAPFLYMLKDGVDEKIARYVRNGGAFVSSYLTGTVDRDDLCFLGGMPGGVLKDVFGIVREETDALPENITGSVDALGKAFEVNHICDIIHARSAQVMGMYTCEFYAGMPALTVNDYGSGKAYYVAFRNDADFCDAFADRLIRDRQIVPDAVFETDGVIVRKRGDLLFLMNFDDAAHTARMKKNCVDVLGGAQIPDEIVVEPCSFKVLKQTE